MTAGGVPAGISAVYDTNLLVLEVFQAVKILKMADFAVLAG